MLTCFNLISQPNDWVLEKNKNEILVYTRKIPGSDYKEVLATTNIKTSLSSLVAILKDVPSHPSWIYNCMQAKMLKEVSDTVQYCYTVSDAPWPADNRDVVYKFTISQDPVTKVVTTNSTSVPDYIPENPGLVRVYVLHTRWEFTPGENGTVEVNYQAHVNAGGSIPVWLVNISIITGPYNTILKMKEVIKKDKYQSAKFDFIEEY